MPLIPFNGSMKLREWWSKVFANDEYLEAKIDAHTNNKSNPHGTTAAQVGAETPAGAQAKADAVQTNLNGHVGAGGTAHAAATPSVAGFMTAADKTKLNGVAAGAQVNQMSFGKVSVSGQGDVDADEEVDTLTLKGGTGISITTNPVTDEVTITATGTATPGAHASSHITGGTDVIPNAVAGGNSGLLSGADKTALDGMNTNLSAASSTAISLQRGVAVYTASRKSRLRLKQLAGRTLVNLLGRDGGCESSTVQTATGGTIATDTTTSLTGSASTKLTMSSTSSVFYPSSTARSGNIFPSVGDYYLTIAEAKHSNSAGQVAVSNIVSGVTAASKGGASATFTTWGIAWRAFNVTAVTTPGTSYLTPYVPITGTSSNTVNIDSCRTYKITAAEYAALDALTAAQVAAKYPYVDDAKSINAVYINNPGRNLLPPFAEWADSTSGYGVITGPYAATITGASGVGRFYSYDVAIVQGQVYYLSGNDPAPGGKIHAYFLDATKTVIGSKLTIGQITPTAQAAYLRVYVNTDQYNGALNFSDVMLNVGSTAAAFEPQRPSYMYLPDCQLRSNVDGSVADTLYTDGQGRPRAVRRFKEVTLDGSLAWSVNGAKLVTFKELYVPGLGASAVKGSGQGVAIKHDGKILTTLAGGINTSAADQAELNTDNAVIVTVSNADSGWGDSYTPSADEIKAYFYGWKMAHLNGTTPYTAAGVAANGAKVWIPVLGFNGSNGTNTLPLDFSTAAQSSGWTAYRLIYQLAASVDEPINYEGDLMLHDGANQIEVGTGVVVRGAAKIGINSGKAYIGASATFRSLRIIEVYKNGLPAGWQKLVRATGDGGIATDGYGYAMIDASLIDPAAAYSVTYLALDTHTLGIAPASIDGEYAPNVKEALDSITRDVTEAKTQLSVLQATKAAKQSPQWIAPTLISGWIPYDATARPVGYYKDDAGIVRLRGNIKSGALSTVAVMLPAGYRPNTVLDFGGFSYKSGSLISEIVIDTGGRIIIQAGGNDLISLDGISFRAEQ